MTTRFVYYRINTRDCPDLAIRDAALAAGLESIEVLAEHGDITFYRVGDAMVASTGGPPVWETRNPEHYAKLETAFENDRAHTVGVAPRRIRRKDKPAGGP